MSSNEFTLDVRQVRAAAKQFKTQIPKEIRNELNKELRAIGRKIAMEAVGAARFKINPSVMTVRTKGPNITIVVRKSEPKPHSGKALAFENHGKPGTFRHPVFGHRDRWVPQKSRPFLTPVAEASYERSVKQIGEAVERAFRLAGFH